jgi:hypothetical protein
MSSSDISSLRQRGGMFRSKWRPPSLIVVIVSPPIRPILQSLF